MRTRFVALAAALVLLALAAVAPGVRRRFIQDIITWDAPPTPAAVLPGATTGPGLERADRVRVVLIDGLGPDTARALRTWSALCDRGVRMRVDVGFPTVSLPVEVTLWSGLTQQQTGVMFRSDVPLVPPLDRRGIPARVPGSVAIAEHHGYIVRSLGFSIAEPAAGSQPWRDDDPQGWAQTWIARATAAVASDARLAFVHVLRVDSWGHRTGSASFEYAQAAGESDAILAHLHAAAPDARWFLLSDHAHLPGGGHGGEDLAIRQVEGCIVGPGIEPARTGLVHIVDVARALADSLGLTLDARSIARPFSVATTTPLGDDDALPPLPLARGVLAIVVLLAGVAASAWGVRRWWLAPLWFVGGCVLLVLVRGAPTMSMPMVYGRENIADLFDPDRRLMMRSWFAMLPLAAVTSYLALDRMTLPRVVAAQLALPTATLAATLVACGGWTALLGAETSPMVPRYTAATLVLMVMVSQGAAAVALGALARTVRQAFGRSRTLETPRSAP